MKNNAKESIKTSLGGEKNAGTAFDVNAQRQNLINRPSTLPPCRVTKEEVDAFRVNVASVGSCLRSVQKLSCHCRLQPFKKKKRTLGDTLICCFTRTTKNL